MRINVTKENVSVTELTAVNANEFCVNECTFTLPSCFSGLTVVAAFNNIPVPLVNNSCFIPSLKKGVCTLGVYAYSEENDSVTLMYSPKPTTFFVEEGSYVESVATEAVADISVYEEYCLMIKSAAEGFVGGAKSNCYTKAEANALYQTMANKTLSVSADSTDTEYPSAKAVYNSLPDVSDMATKVWVTGQIAASLIVDSEATV